MCEIKYYNILFLGETGAGKSTFINAFGNYASYETLNEAKNGHLIALVGTTYTIIDEEFNEITIEACNDDDETNVAGESATQKCKTHLFSIDDKSIVRIIDTPGVADTRGIEQDKLNFQNIIKFIEMNKNIHAVCIVLKANQTRITEHFSYCLRQLLSQLHKSVLKNIIFLFTHGRSVNYNLGGPIKLLKKFLENVKKDCPNIEIKISKDNVYCFESDSFNYLLCLKESKIVYNCNFEESWIKSRDECLRMLKHIIALSPHDANDTLYIHKTRHLLEHILDPIATTIEIIDANLNFIEKHRKDLELVKDDINKLRKLMNTPSIELETKKLKNPNMVCKSKTCRSTYNSQGICKVFYPQICCPDCGPWKHLFSHGSHVKFASKSFFGPLYCSKCNCKAIEHDLVYTQNKIVNKRVSDKDLYDEITTIENMMEAKQQLLEQNKQRCETLEKERDIIIKSIAKFSVFIQKNLLSTHKDVFAENINVAMTDAIKDLNIKKTESLNNTLKLYETEKEKIYVNHYDTTTKEMTRIIEELCSLKLTGPSIKQVYSIVEQALVEKYYEEKNRKVIKLNKFFSNQLRSKK